MFCFKAFYKRMQTFILFQWILSFVRYMLLVLSTKEQQCCLILSHACAVKNDNN